MKNNNIYHAIGLINPKLGWQDVQRMLDIVNRNQGFIVILQYILGHFPDTVFKKSIQTSRLINFYIIKFYYLVIFISREIQSMAKEDTHPIHLGG